MSLSIYRDEEFNIGTLVDQVDVYTGDGSTVTYTIENKTSARIGSTIQFDNIFYYQYNGGFTKSGEEVTLDSAPPFGSEGVVPGVGTITASAFDTDDIPGASNPREDEVPFYLVDPDDIYQYEYDAFSDNPGIAISVTDLIESTGAQVSWCQLACSEPDGTASTYQASGEVFYTPPLTAFGEVTSTTSAGASVISCDSASDFIAGDFILINRGEVTQETLRILEINGTDITTSTSNFDHNPGEIIYTCGREFFLKVTIPEGAFNYQATNDYSLGMRVVCVKRSRY